MKCQKCKVNNATTQVKRIVNGAYEEYMLCADCAHEMGFDNVFDTAMPDMFGGLVKSLFGTALPSRSQATRCPSCGSTYGDITNTGKVGCAKCYTTFFSELLPSVKRIHGNTTHCGKRPNMALAEESVANQKEDQIGILKTQLNKAVEEQNFELAAELRDKIKEMEGK
ncbi:MAG: UvrB/UvrC motif-containing protein [Clostridia bacterium]|nr:UvrB/UvrC motif-containing protein [Clostridia bacterium]